MQHLLLTRFQGALIGGNIIYLTPQQIAPNQLAIDTAPSLKAGIASLMRCGGFNEQDWLASTSSVAAHPDRAIVAMLPIMLFFHDDRAKLREVILNLGRSWQLDWETCSCAVAIGCIIARSLTERFSPSAIITQVLDETVNLHPLLFQQLGAVDRLLEQSSSLAQTAQRFLTTEHPTIAETVLAIYCFLSSPEDFSLAILRARQIQAKSQLICTLTGIFAGTQNSSSSIPLNGLLATQEREQWLLAAKNLLDLWAGVYDASTQPIGLLPPGSQPAVAYGLPVAAPKVMQRRD
jgi:hypothetical protein